MKAKDLMAPVSVSMRRQAFFSINDTAFAVRYLQRGIADFSCLFAEDSPQQALFGSQLSLALGGDLTDQVIAGTDFRTDADARLTWRGREWVAVMREWR